MPDRVIRLVLLSTHCLLLTTYCLLKIAHCIAPQFSLIWRFLSRSKACFTSSSLMYFWPSVPNFAPIEFKSDSKLVRRSCALSQPAGGVSGLLELSLTRSGPSSCPRLLKASVAYQNIFSAQPTPCAFASPP